MDPQNRPSPPSARLAQVAAHFDAGQRVISPAPSPSKAASRASPSLILIFGWTAAPRSALERYATEYKKLYPSAQSLLFPVVFTDFLAWPARSAAQTARGFDELLAAIDVLDNDSEILVHIFSGGGATRFAMIASLYRRARSRTLPVRVLVCDSGPTDASSFSRARTLNDNILFAQSGSLVKEVMRPAFMLGLGAMHVWTLATGQDDFTTLSWEGLLDPELVPPEAVRGYVYSAHDIVVKPDEVERHVELALQRGLDVEVEKFADSKHVSHAKKDPERYWGFVRRLWEKSKKV
ncbi:hypothetical protein TWF694_007798 [Orbilia ellipsospora]|uniref:DUF829-domain-containing protein n=1 Tax=Orbilia ellipsospora TaxID=2528407 RepID=A0AAV9XIW6_9PEZI